MEDATTAMASAIRKPSNSVTEAGMRRYSALLTACVMLFSSGIAAAQDEPGSEPRTSSGEDESAENPPPQEVEPPSPYRNPAGSVQISGAVSVAVGNEQTVFGLGIGVGYAVITGVVPGFRALLLVGGDEVAGELATTLTLTPPLATYLVPFVLGEVGRRFDGLGGAWLFGAGGGVYLGEPQAGFGLQLGWIFRKYVYESGSISGNGPIIAVSISL